MDDNSRSDLIFNIAAVQLEEPRDLPAMADLVTGIAADIDHQVRLRDDLVGAAHRIRPHHPYTERVIIQNRTLAID